MGSQGCVQGYKRAPRTYLLARSFRCVNIFSFALLFGCGEGYKYKYAIPKVNDLGIENRSAVASDFIGYAQRAEYSEYL